MKRLAAAIGLILALALTTSATPPSRTPPCPKPLPGHEPIPDLMITYSSDPGDTSIAYVIDGVHPVSRTGRVHLLNTDFGHRHHADSIYVMVEGTGRLDTLSFAGGGRFKLDRNGEITLRARVPHECDPQHLRHRVRLVFHRAGTLVESHGTNTSVCDPLRHHPMGGPTVVVDSNGD